MPFVYALVDPLEPKHLRYIGVATRSAERPLSHLKKAVANPSTIAHKWINTLIDAGRIYEVLILVEFPEGTPRYTMFQAEKNVIRSAARAGHQLLNYNEQWAADERDGKHDIKGIVYSSIVTLSAVPYSSVPERVNEKQRLRSVKAQQRKELYRAKQQQRIEQQVEKQRKQQLRRKQEASVWTRPEPARRCFQTTRRVKKLVELPVNGEGMPYGICEDDSLFIERFIRHSGHFRFE